MRYLIALVALSIVSLALSAQTAPTPRVEEKDFGKIPDGQTVTIYTLHNANGMSAQVMTYGATIVSIEAPDRDGKVARVVLGAESFDRYLRNYPTAAQTIGRVANRIAGAKFTLDGKD